MTEKTTATTVVLYGAEKASDPERFIADFYEFVGMEFDWFKKDHIRCGRKTVGTLRVSCRRVKDDYIPERQRIKIRLVDDKGKKTGLIKMHGWRKTKSY